MKLINRLFFTVFLYCSFVYVSAVDIAITIDDHPMADGQLFSLQARTKQFISTLAKHNYQAAFFCIGGTSTTGTPPRYLALLSSYGHFLANHSMTHRHLSAIPIEEFANEIIQADELLTPYATAKKWFRYPYLDMGESEQKTLQARTVLQRLGYIEGYVSINTFDWLINARLQQALKRGDTVDYQALKHLYLRLLKEWCTFYIDLYEKNLPSKITHTLLLHANDLNALYLADIFAMINKAGWHLASPELAFQDTSWRNAIYKNPLLAADPDNLACDEIDKLIAQYHVFTPQ